MKQTNEPASRLPLGLRTIALFEGAKGVLAFAAACGLLSLRHTDLHAVTDAFLLRHGFDPEQHCFYLGKLLAQQRASRARQLDRQGAPEASG